MKNKTKGLGDLVEKITEVTGIKSVVETVSEALGIEDCGCSRRRDFLNEKFPIKSTSKTLTPQDDNDFISGIYKINCPFSIKKENNEYLGKPGDKIYIKDNHPAWDDLKILYSKGIIEKE